MKPGIWPTGPKSACVAINDANPRFDGQGKLIILIDMIKIPNDLEIPFIDYILPNRPEIFQTNFEVLDEGILVDIKSLSLLPDKFTQGRNIPGSADLQPIVLIPLHQLEGGPHDLAEHGTQVSRGVLPPVDLGAEFCLADPEPADDGRRRHPDVDPEFGHIRFPDILFEIEFDHCRRQSEVTANGLPDLLPIEGPRQIVCNRVGDGPIQLIALVVGSDIIVAFDDRIQNIPDPFRSYGKQIGIKDRDGSGFEK